MRLSKDWRTLLKLTGKITGILLLAGFFTLGGIAFGAVRGIIERTPGLDLDSIAPKGYATMIYDSKGNLTDTLVMEGSNRDPAAFEELPEDLINAFVAIEDARFWEHNGIDLRAIARAAVGVLTGNSKGGGSTITQQLIKNNVLGGGRETSFGAKLERKLKEQYLAVQLTKVMDKETVLVNYLNTINLGNNTLGVKMAARRYFDKEVSELTLSESAVIAGITQNPARLNPLGGREANEEKRRVILQYMEEQGYITEEERQEALADPVYDRIQSVDVARQEADRVYSYFTDETIRQATGILTGELSYTENQAYNLLYGGGLTIRTAQDPDIQAVVDREVNNLEHYPVTRFSLDYRLSVRQAGGQTVHYSQEDIKKWNREEGGRYPEGIYDTREAAEEDVRNYKSWRVKEGYESLGERTELILEPQVSFVILEPSTGQVKAISGGRGEKRANLTLNRATDALRQPGSAFKILTGFAPALDVGQKTLADVYYDGPYRVGEKAFSNWYSGYTGYSNIRDGIVYSMNIVAVRCLMETVSPELGTVYARNFGITTLTDTDANPALVLGGVTDGVTNLELTAAFGAIGNGGVYREPVFITEILDRNGNVLYRAPDRKRQVIRETTAFLLTDAMAESMTGSRKFSFKSLGATSARSAFSGMSQAGKSGTTTSNKDIWFVGFTPYYAAGIWAGYDENQVITGGTSFHKDIWRTIMGEIHEGLPDPGFSVPAGITGAYVCRKSGKRPIPGVCDADPRGNAVYREYFAVGTEPEEYCDRHVQAAICTETGMTASPECPQTELRTFMRVDEGEGSSEDRELMPPEGCTLHGAASGAEETLGSGERLPGGGPAGERESVTGETGPDGRRTSGSGRTESSARETGGRWNWWSGGRWGWNYGETARSSAEESREEPGTVNRGEPGAESPAESSRDRRTEAWTERSPEPGGGTAKSGPWEKTESAGTDRNPEESTERAPLWGGWRLEN